MKQNTALERFNPQLLIMARVARGLTQTELAEKLGITQCTVSRVEDGLRMLPPQLVDPLEAVLRYPIEFYCEAGEYEAAPAHLYRRKLSLGTTILGQKAAQMAIGRRQVRKLLQSCEPVEARVPRFDPEELKGGATEVARRLRLHWRIPPGPIVNLTAVLEKAGCLIIPFDFGTPKIDGCADHVDGHPVIFLNTGICSSRQRFTLAHELGHLVMHDLPTETTEDDSNRFASEFMMPADQIRGMFAPISLDRLGQLKLHWKMSMQAILVWADKLGAVSGYRKRQLWQQISSKGFRSAEPFEELMPRERPALFRQLIEVHVRDLGYAEEELAKKLQLFPSELREQFFQQPRIVRFG